MSLPYPEIRLIIIAVRSTQVLIHWMVDGIHHLTLDSYAHGELNSQQPIGKIALPHPRITSAQEYKLEYEHTVWLLLAPNEGVARRGLVRGDSLI